MGRLTSIAAMSALLCCVGLIELANPQTIAQKGAPKASAAKTQAAPPPAAFPCDGNTARLIQPTAYAVGLAMHRNLVAVGSPSRSLRAPLVIFIKDASQGLFPLGQNPGRRGPPYFAICGDEVPETALYARMTIRAPHTDAALAQLLGTALNAEGYDLKRWQAVPFRSHEGGASFIEWPAQYRTQIPITGMLLELTRQYVAAGPRTLLANAPVDVSVRRTIGRTGEEVAKWPAVAARSTPAPQAGTKTGAPADTPNQPTTPRAAAPPAGAPATRDVTFIVSFRNRERWRDFRLDEMQRLSTFGYCNEAITRNEGGASYTLQCQPGVDEKIPIGIRGFQPVFVSLSEAREIDLKLESLEYRVPYPPAWRRGSAFAPVRGGRLNEVLQSPISLDQAIPNATACIATTQVTVADIIEQKLEFPAPPCRSYEIEFNPGLTDGSAQIVSGCFAGAPDARPITNRRISCWWQTRAQRAPVTLQAQLITSFEPVGLSIEQSMLEAGFIRFSFDDLSDRLIPRWPYAGATPLPGSAEVPRFAVRAVDYRDTRGEACGQARRLERQSMPDLRSAGCQSIPAIARMTLEQEPVAGGPPPKAFVASHQHDYDLRTGTSAAIDSEQLKLSLPVRFGPQKVEEYNDRFRIGPTGRTSAPGVYVYAGNSDQRCTGRRDGTLVPFAGDAAAKTFKWPQVAAVYDNTIAEWTMMTICSVAKVEEQNGQPYLTFDLEATRASGPRRVILIVNSQSLQNRTAGLRDALRKLVEVLEGEYRARMPLSPVSVYAMDNRENLREVFTGELAARKPNDARLKITSDIDSAAPRTPELKYLKMQPEVRNIERLTVVMDGTTATDDDKSAVLSWARDFARAGGEIVFFVSTNCSVWPVDPPVQGFRCLPFNQAEVTRLFTEFVIRGEQPADNRSNVPPGQPKGRK